MRKFAIATAAALTAAAFGMTAMAQDSSNDFASADANADGSISFEEAVGVYPTLTQILFDQADENDDGVLSEAEFTGLAGLSGAIGGSTDSGGADANASPPPAAPPPAP